jgi:autotransporter translocation and assembly factor TamB
LELGALGLVRIDPRAVVSPKLREPLHAALVAHARIEDPKLRAAASVSCIACPIALDAVAWMRRDHARGPLALALDARTAGATLLASADLHGDGRRDLRARLDAPDLATVTGTIARFADVPPVAGALEVAARCRGTTGLRCGIVAEARRIRTGEVRVDAARVELDVWPRDRIELVLHDAWARSGEIEAKLLGPATVRIGDGDIALEGVGVGVAGARLYAHGRVGTSWDLRASAEVPDLSRLRAFAPKIAMAGTLDASAHVVDAAGPATAEVHMNARALTIDTVRLGALDLDVEADREGVHAELAMRGGPARSLHVRARVPATFDLQARRMAWRRGVSVDVAAAVRGLRLPELAGLVDGPSLRGVVDADFALVGTPARPQIDVRVLGRDLVVDRRAIGVVTLEAGIAGERAQAHLQASGPLARAVDVDVAIPVRVRLDRPGVQWLSAREHVLRAQIDDVSLGGVAKLTGVPAHGRLSANARVSGPGDALAIHLGLAVDDLEWKSETVGDVEVALAQRAGRLTLDASLRKGPRSRVQVNARAPVVLDAVARELAWNREGDHRVEIAAVDCDRGMMAPFVALPRGVKLELNAELLAHGNLDDFSLAARGRGSVRRGDDLGTPFALHVGADPRVQSAQLVVGPHRDRALLVELHAWAPVDRLVAGTSDVGAVRVRGQARGHTFPLDPLAPLLTAVVHDPSGTLDLEATLAGTVGDPRLRGHVAVREGELTVLALNQRFERVELDASFTGDHAELTRLQLRSGRGRASASGQARWDASGTRASARLVARKLPIVRPGLPLVTVDTDVRAELDRTDRRTRVDLRVGRTLIDVYELSVGATRKIPQSDHVVIVSSPEDERAAREQPVSGAPPAQPRSRSADDEEPDPVALALGVDLAEGVRIRGTGVDMDWRGRLRASGGPGGREVSGRISARRGYFEMFGNEFRIERGEVVMPKEGELDPFVTLVAHADTPEAQVTLEVRGRASRPTLKLSSDPAMSQSQILTLLVTGSSDSSGADSDEVQAKAASLLAAFGNPALERALRQRVGIDRVGIGFGESVEQPILKVGKRLGRKVYVEARYKHNAPIDENMAEVHVEYAFVPRWVVETFFGDRAAGGIDVFWRKRFGLPRRRD